MRDTYINTVDIWSFGYACYNILFRKAGRDPRQADTTWQKAIIPIIADNRMQAPLENNIGSIAACILDRNPIGDIRQSMP